jgi:cell wall-associated NlpC family hydrolase
VSGLDRRLTPARPDLAWSGLAGRVEAARFVEGRIMHVAWPAIALRPEPSLERGIDTEALHGEEILVLDEAEGWAWGRLATDGYVGYMPASALREGRSGATHRVATLRTFVYPGPDMKLPVASALPFGARVAVTGAKGDFALTPDGAIFAAHLEPVDARADDPVAVAEMFLGVPYLWGGRSSLGLDCSALLQTALRAAGHDAPRDSDMLEAAVGARLPEGAPLARGDCLFWKGHCAMLRDAETMIHASGRHMLVVSEPVAAAVERIAGLGGGPVRAIRRPGPAPARGEATGDLR